MNEDAGITAVSFNHVGDRNLLFIDKPHIAIDTTMISKVECILRFARRITLVIRVVSHHSHHTLIALLQSLLFQVDDNRQVTAEVLLSQFAVHINLLLAHYRLEIDFRAIARHDKSFAIPGYTLIVAAARSLSRFQFHTMRGRNHLPACIIIVGTFCALHITQMEPPVGIEIPHLASLVADRKQTRHRCIIVSRCLCRACAQQKHHSHQYVISHLSTINYKLLTITLLPNRRYGKS